MNNKNSEIICLYFFLLVLVFFPLYVFPFFFNFIIVWQT